MLTISQYREWFHEHVADPPQKQPGLAAMDAYERADATGVLSPSDLALVMAAASDRHVVVWDVGVELLLRLSARFVEAQDAVREMSGSRKVNERFQLVASLKAGPPEALLREVILRALDDKGYRVREKAAEASDRLQMTDLLPHLEARLAIETDPRIRAALTFHSAMLRDGYLVKRDDDGPQIWIRTQQGWISPTIQEADLEPERLARIVREARAGPY
jgi:hypothetical protein